MPVPALEALSGQSHSCKTAQLSPSRCQSFTVVSDSVGKQPCVHARSALGVGTSLT